MWTRSHSKVIKGIDKEKIWDRWSDVNRWHEWVPNIEYCRLDNPFQQGSEFILKPKGGSPVTVQLVSVESNHKFTGCTRFFGATMYDTHEMHQDPEGIRLTVTLKVTGPLGFLWRMLVAEKIANNLPTLLRNLASSVSTPSLKKSTSHNIVPEIKLNTLAPKKPKLRLIASEPKKDKSKSSPSSTLKKAKLEVIDAKPKNTSSQSKTKTAVIKKAPLKANVASVVKKTKLKTIDAGLKKTPLQKAASQSKAKADVVKKPKLKASALPLKKDKPKPKKVAAKKPKEKGKAGASKKPKV